MLITNYVGKIFVHKMFFFVFINYDFFSLNFFVFYTIFTSLRCSDLSLTNSFATSSLVRCDNIRNIVQPVSSR